MRHLVGGASAPNCKKIFLMPGAPPHNFSQLTPLLLWLVTAFRADFIPFPYGNL